MKWFLKALGKYAQFNGRAGLMEFWMFVLFGLVIIPLFITLFIEIFITVFYGFHYSIIYFYWLAILVPFLAVQSRRLQDTNRSGWLLLLHFVPFGTIVLIVMSALPSEQDKISNKPGVQPIFEPKTFDNFENDISNSKENTRINPKSRRSGSSCALGIIGVFIGAFIGAISGYGMGQSRGYTGGDSIGSIMMAFGGIVTGAIIGLIIGLIIGAMIKRNKKS